jgi:hypothetical protein
MKTKIIIHRAYLWFFAAAVDALVGCLYAGWEVEQRMICLQKKAQVQAAEICSFMTVWGYKHQQVYMLSSQEDGISLK